MNKKQPVSEIQLAFRNRHSPEMKSSVAKAFIGDQEFYLVVQGHYSFTTDDGFTISSEQGEQVYLDNRELIEGHYSARSDADGYAEPWLEWVDSEGNEVLACSYSSVSHNLVPEREDFYRRVVGLPLGENGAPLSAVSLKDVDPLYVTAAGGSPDVVSSRIYAMLTQNGESQVRPVFSKEIGGETYTLSLVGGVEIDKKTGDIVDDSSYFVWVNAEGEPVLDESGSSLADISAALFPEEAVHWLLSFVEGQFDEEEDSYARLC